MGLAVPEEFGGSDAGWLALSIFLNEAGRVLLPTAYLSTAVLAPWILQAPADAALRHELLPRIAAGEIRVGFADIDGKQAVITHPDGDQIRLSGVKTTVIDGAVCDYFLVTVDDAGPSSVYVVDASDPGVDVAQGRPLDETRPSATVTFTNVAARSLGAAHAATNVAASARDLLAIALAAEGAGAAEQCLDMSVEYAKIREQFGRPIGQFQAIKHKCADMFVGVQASYAAVHAAFQRIDETGIIDPIQAKVSASYVSAALMSVTSETMQIHGGIAFSWEHDAHLYLKRATSDQILLGGPDRQIAALADDLLDGGKSVLELISGQGAS
ncbi:MAG: mmgC16 [Nocardioidaceae bacterium]|nr:mmgC16 [Nocardioidaceae bacterium]